MVAGLWSSLSGAGRFVSRGASGFLVDQVPNSCYWSWSSNFDIKTAKISLKSSTHFVIIDAPYQMCFNFFFDTQFGFDAVSSIACGMQARVYFL